MKLNLKFVLELKKNGSAVWKVKLKNNPSWQYPFLFFVMNFIFLVWSEFIPTKLIRLIIKQHKRKNNDKGLPCFNLQDFKQSRSLRPTSLSQHRSSVPHLANPPEICFQYFLEHSHVQWSRVRIRDPTSSDSATKLLINCGRPWGVAAPSLWTKWKLRAAALSVQFHDAWRHVGAVTSYSYFNNTKKMKEYPLMLR